MIPELFSIGPLTVYSYGLMLGIAFIIGSYLLTKETVRKGLPDSLATEVTLIAIIFGIIGSKMFHLFGNLDAFFARPFAEAFSPSGLTFHGGLLLAILTIFLYLKRKKIPFLYIADAAAPALALAYGIGRIGCHLSGDGDYGLPTSLPWGTNYENGVVKPSSLFHGSEIAKSFPNGVVPNNTPLHPTPVYEFLGAVLIFSLLWYFRKKGWIDGRLFGLYLILAGGARFTVEFLRLNPSLFLGLTEAQVIAILMIVGGLLLTWMGSKYPERFRFKPAPLPPAPKKKKK